MKTRHLLPVMVLLVAVASVHAVKLGPSGWVIGTEEANGIVGFLPGVTVSAYDNVIVAISGNSPLDAVTSITVNMTESGNPGAIVAEVSEIHKMDSSGGFNPTDTVEMIALYLLENFLPGTYDLHCLVEGLTTETIVFGYQVLKSQYGEYITYSFPSPSKVSGEAVETLNLNYQVQDPGGYSLEAISSNDQWIPTGHSPGGTEIFSVDGSRELHAYRVNETGFIIHSHDVDFGGSNDAAIGIGVYFVGYGGTTPQWKGYDIVKDVWVDTLDWMGWLQVANDPYIYSLSLSGWMYIPESQDGVEGAWAYIYR